MVVRIHGAETNKVIAIFLVCKHCFCYLNVLTTEAKEPIVSRANEPVVGTLISLGDLTYCRGQTQKTMNTWNFSGMLIVYWPIAIKFRICKLTSKPQTNYRCCLRFSYLLPYWLISHNTTTFHKYLWCSQFCEFHSKILLLHTFWVSFLLMNSYSV